MDRVARKFYWSVRYYGLDLTIVSGIVNLLSLLWKDLAPVFVDYGSGKGQALILAAFFPFKRVLGVEISYKLHLIAQNNIKRFRARMVKCRNIISICEDATTFALPEDPLVLYFFYPFKEEVLKKVISNIRRSLAQCFRHMIILYKYPQLNDPLVGMEFNDLLDSTDFLCKVNIRFSDPRWEIYETLSGGKPKPM